jgi:hypothetical protein
LLILLESIVLELLEYLVVGDGVFAIWSIVAIAADVKEDLVEHVVLEVYTVTDVDVTTTDRDITCGEMRK